MAKKTLAKRIKGWFSDITFPGSWEAPDVNNESIWTGSEAWGEGQAPGLKTPTSQIASNRSFVYICNQYNARAVANQRLGLYKGATHNIPTAKAVRKISKEQTKHLGTKRHLHDWLVKAEDDIEEVVESPVLDLFKQTNPVMNQIDLWMMTETNLGLTGNAYWWLRPNSFGEPYQIWIWNSDRMKVILGEGLDDYIKAYLYVADGAKQDVPFEPESIVHHRYPNPQSPVIGLSPVMALSDSVIVNQEIYRYEKAQFKNMARPDGVLEMTESLTDEEFKRLKSEWAQTYQGSTKSGKVAILEGGVDYKAISVSPREMNHLEGRRMTKEEIANGYGIPMSLLSPEKSNRANATVAYEQYMRDTVSPKLKMYEEKINKNILPQFKGGEKMFVAFDNCVPEDKDFAVKERLTSLKAGYKTWNEVRAEAGLKPYEDFGDNPVVPQTLVDFGEKPPMLAAPEQSMSEEDEEKVLNSLADALAKRIVG